MPLAKLLFTVANDTPHETRLEDEEILISFLRATRLDLQGNVPFISYLQSHLNVEDDHTRDDGRRNPLRKRSFDRKPAPGDLAFATDPLARTLRRVDRLTRQTRCSHLADDHRGIEECSPQPTNRQFVAVDRIAGKTRIGRRNGDSCTVDELCARPTS